MTDAYPLQWPEGFERTPPEQRQRARFGASHGVGMKPLTIAQARKRLLLEVDRFTKRGEPCRIHPDLVVISTNVPTRKDGLPYSNAREPDDPGVAVYFHMDGEPYCFPCDAWDRVADNIAAVAAHLGAMRGIERWRVGDLRQAFTGWRALPAPGETAAPSWREVLCVGPDATFAYVQAQYKRARREHHPDHGGDPDKFHLVQQAWEQARKEFGA